MRPSRRGLNHQPGSQPPPSVQLTGATVTYGPAPGIADIDLRVDAGAFLSVTGASGAGKTTLLWAIAGTTPLTSGTVYVNGHEIRDHSTAISQGVALIPQGNGLANVLTAHENIALTLTSLGHGPASTAARTSEALDLVGLTESSNHLIDELSGGQQQRVAVARALATRALVTLAEKRTHLGPRPPQQRQHPGPAAGSGQPRRDRHHGHPRPRSRRAQRPARSP